MARVYEQTRTSSSRWRRAPAQAVQVVSEHRAPRLKPRPHDRRGASSMTLDVDTLDQVLLVGTGVLLLAILAVRLSVGVGSAQPARLPADGRCPR